ncbi:GNAT family N-acetyltransferase [Streptomyces spinoverrucosus]|uniref:GNAT family N-acetyltransferase n=1 Tax=Streptomyces spinoverrucosus TaxID=284043 RepID=UPI0018C3FBAA|nr:GNAT family N-acetyltransferase [Streptomyces spinoverrucosus]MBG0854208.1 GNAT family N-acetyltransferase [Streptomyces spinoverrucosus]
MSISAEERYVVRSLRAEEWPAMRELRLAALRDPVARIAFLETYEEAVARPESFWRERAERAAQGQAGARQVVAEGPDGALVGTLTVLVEEPGTTDWAGFPVERRQGHVVGVYMRPELRGCGLTELLFDEALEWCWARGLERVRLIVHEENGRAQAFYRKLGFEASGLTVPLAGQPDACEREFVLERG